MSSVDDRAKFIAPINAANGNPAAEANSLGRGSYTLVAGTTYVVGLDMREAPVGSVHLQWDNAIIITSAQIEDKCFPDLDVPLTSTVAGEWVPETPTTAYVGTVGGGASVVNGVLAVAAGSQGGAVFHAVDSGSGKTRFKIVVGGTGGVVRVGRHSKLVT